MRYPMATPGPVVVQAVVDPFEPPLPAQLTLEQAIKLAESLARGRQGIERYRVKDARGVALPPAGLRLPS